MASTPQAARDVSLPVHAQPSADAFVDAAVHAEELGYNRVWLPETWGRDAVSLLATMAARTEEIGLGSSILNVYARSPAILGQTAVTLQELSGGRFRLGLGPSGPAVIERWHGAEFDQPLKRTREAVEIARMVTRGDQVDYDGEVFQVGGFRLRSDPPETPPPVDVTGMGPTAVELAGRFADGWHATMLTRDGFRERVTDLERGANLGDRSVADVRTTLSVPCCVLEDREQARDLARGHLAFYVAAMGDFYREALTTQGHGDTASAITAAWNDGDREAAKAAIGDGLLDQMAVAGSPEEARDRLGEFTAIDGLDAIAVSFPRGTDDAEIEQTMAALAPA